MTARMLLLSDRDRPIVADTYPAPQRSVPEHEEGLRQDRCAPSRRAAWLTALGGTHGWSLAAHSGRVFLCHNYRACCGMPFTLRVPVLRVPGETGTVQSCPATR